MFATNVLIALSTASLMGLIKAQGLSRAPQMRPAHVFPTRQIMDAWASEIDLTLKHLTNGETDITGASQYESKYQRSLDENEAFEIRHADGKEILSDMASQISQIFSRNIQALKNLQESTEKAIQNYTYEEDLRLADVPYLNMNDLGNVSNQLEYDSHFKQPIYTESSGVHIPIEIYEGYNSNQMSRICANCTSVCDLCSNGLFWRQDSNFALLDVNIIKDPHILNGIKWTSALDEVFKKNRKLFPDIYWQNFGAQNGILRVYPAVKWPIVDGLPDLYDVRRRPWYIHGSSSPKDMIILLDTSGSMHGQSFDIMKLAAKTLLNTLGENDFVNVARFASNVTWVTPCLTGLVQANARNKRLLFDGIDSLVDHHVANYSQALEFAYSAFEEFQASKASSDGSECHKLIMVFSDGGTEYPSKIIKVFSNKSREVTKDARIFSYAVGPHPIPTVALKKMGCDTKGSFTTITAMGAICTKIQDYIRVLNKPLVLNKPDVFQKNIMVKDYLGLGFLTTVTLPVFNTSALSNNQTLAGVVGIDIPIFTFKDLAPRSKLGPLGYSFGLNTNGFVLWHPDLWMVTNYFEDPAHSDFAEVEGSNGDLEKIRYEMIDLAADQGLNQASKTVLVANTLQPGHAHQVLMEYHYGSIAGTLFAVGVVLPKNWDYLKVPHQPNAKYLLTSLNQEETILAPWKICDETKKNPDSDPDTLDYILQAIKEGNCSGDDFSHLIWDIKVAKDVFDSLKYEDRFVLLDGGLTFFKSKSDALPVFSDPYNSTLYRLSVSSESAVLFLETHTVKEVIPLYQVRSWNESIARMSLNEDEAYAYEEDTHYESDSETTVKDEDRQGHASPPLQTSFIMQPEVKTSLHLARSFRVMKQGKKFIAGVAGVTLPLNFLNELLMNSTTTARSGMHHCGEASEMRCYFTDFSGYLLASNQPSVKVGSFLGVVDEQIMRLLINSNSFFDEKPEFNYQALCPNPVVCVTASGSIMKAAAASFFQILRHLFFRLATFMQHFSFTFYSILASIYLPVDSVSAVSEYGNRIPDGLHRCTTKMSHWYLKEDAPNYWNQTSINICESFKCKRQVHLYKMLNINGLLILAEPICEFCKNKPLFDSPTEVEEEEGCHLPYRYRRRPDECFSHHKNEIHECSRAVMNAPVPLLTLLLALPLFMMRRL